MGACQTTVKNSICFTTPISKKALVIDSLSEKCNFPKRQNDMVKW